MKKKIFMLLLLLILFSGCIFSKPQVGKEVDYTDFINTEPRIVWTSGNDMVTVKFEKVKDLKELTRLLDYIFKIEINSDYIPKEYKKYSSKKRYKHGKKDDSITSIVHINI